jgi:hypothetical protein
MFPDVTGVRERVNAGTNGSRELIPSGLPTDLEVAVAQIARLHERAILRRGIRSLGAAADGRFRRPSESLGPRIPQQAFPRPSSNEFGRSAMAHCLRGMRRRLLS